MIDGPNLISTLPLKSTDGCVRTNNSWMLQNNRLNNTNSCSLSSILGEGILWVRKRYVEYGPHILKKIKPLLKYNQYTGNSLPIKRDNDLDLKRDLHLIINNTLPLQHEGPLHSSQIRLLLLASQNIAARSLS